MTYCRISGLILGLYPANERQRYFVTTSLIGWVKPRISPADLMVLIYCVSLGCYDIFCHQPCLCIMFVEAYFLWTPYYKLSYHPDIWPCCHNKQHRGGITLRVYWRLMQKKHHSSVLLFCFKPSICFADNIFKAVPWKRTFSFWFRFQWFLPIDNMS